MDSKKGQTTHLSDTISALDSAVDQWNSITNNPETKQAPEADQIQKETQDLLTKLKDQLEAFAEDDCDDDDLEVPLDPHTEKALKDALLPPENKPL